MTILAKRKPAELKALVKEAVAEFVKLYTAGQAMMSALPKAVYVPSCWTYEFETTKRLAGRYDDE